MTLSHDRMRAALMSIRSNVLGSSTTACRVGARRQPGGGQRPNEYRLLRGESLAALAIRGRRRSAEV